MRRRWLWQRVLRRTQYGHLRARYRLRRLRRAICHPTLTPTVAAITTIAAITPTVAATTTIATIVTIATVPAPDLLH